MLRQAPHALRADARATDRAKVRGRRHLVGRFQQRRRGWLELTLTVAGPQAQRQAHHLAGRQGAAGTARGGRGGMFVGANQGGAVGEDRGQMRAAMSVAPFRRSEQSVRG